MSLLPHQVAAVRFARAAGATGADPPAAERLGRLTAADRADGERLARRIARGRPIDVHFHPDRIAANGLTVVESLAALRTYDNQFVTGISNGGLDAATAGGRRRWETRLFGGAYDGRPDADRPKYGALNLFDTDDGACPRFGSCHFRLRPETARRCTLSWGDSHLRPDARGTPDAPGRLLEALVRDFSGEERAGTSLARLSRRLGGRPARAGGPFLGRILDDCVEVQLHGPLSIPSDVSWLSADASFEGTATGRRMLELADACGIELRWRPALVLPPEPVPAAFRGAATSAFVESLRVAGPIDAARLGAVARSAVRDPAAWSAWGTPAAVLQLVKRAWHATVAFGEPDDEARPGAPARRVVPDRPGDRPDGHGARLPPA